MDQSNANNRNATGFISTLTLTKLPRIEMSKAVQFNEIKTSLLFPCALNIHTCFMQFSL